MENKAKLRWGCRRGMLELDAILLPFFDKKFDGLSKQQQAQFEELLNSEDQDLFAWLMDIKPIDNPKLTEIIKLIMQK